MKTETTVTIVGGLIAAVVGLLTIPTLLKSSGSGSSGGAPSFSGGDTTVDAGSGGGSSPLSGFFDWLGSLVHPAQTVPTATATNPAAGTRGGYSPGPGTVPTAGGGGMSPTMPTIHPAQPAPPRSAPTHVPTAAPGGGSAGGGGGVPGPVRHYNN
jgi:hypothetical protein